MSNESLHNAACGITDAMIDAAEHDRGDTFADEITSLAHSNTRLALRGLVRAEEVKEAGYSSTEAFMAGVAFAERAARQRDAARALLEQLGISTGTSLSEHDGASPAA